jgi:hypothetical protein
VDDIVLFASNPACVIEIKEALSKRYKMSDLGEIRQFLSLQIERDRERRTLFLHQRRNTEKVLQRFGMENCKGVATPMDPKTFLKETSKEFDNTGRLDYQSMIGSIMFAMLGTRPDIAFPISTLSKFNSCPTPIHHVATKRVLRYLQQTRNTGLLYQCDSAISEHTMPKPICYSDSDWAGDREDRKSTGGYVFTLCGAAISWRTKKQKSVAASTTEAEYIALSEAVKESIWINRLLCEIKKRDVTHPLVDLQKYHQLEIRNQWELLGAVQMSMGDVSDNRENLAKDNADDSSPQIIFADNQASIKLAENPNSHDRTKHIDIRYHIVREALANGSIFLQYVPTNEMVADIFTKGLPRDAHERHAQAMGLNERNLD